MKKFFSLFLFFVMLAVLPVKSHAIADFEVFGGYIFKGDADGSASDFKGPVYGFRGHFNKDFLMINAGIGGYWQKTDVDYKDNFDGNTKITSYGFDLYVKLDLSAIPVKPYLRAGLGIKDKYEMSFPGFSQSSSEKFDSNYYGMGLALSVLPLPVVSLELYGEYIYSKYKGNTKTNFHSFNVGAMASL